MSRDLDVNFLIPVMVGGSTPGAVSGGEEALT